MLRVEAERAMITVPPSRDRRADKCPAMPALEFLAAVRSTLGFRVGATRVVVAVPPPDLVMVPMLVVRPIVLVQSWHVGVLLAAPERSGETNGLGSTRQ